MNVLSDVEQIIEEFDSLPDYPNFSHHNFKCLSWHCQVLEKLFDLYEAEYLGASFNKERMEVELRFKTCVFDVASPDNIFGNAMTDATRFCVEVADDNILYTIAFPLAR